MSKDLTNLSGYVGFDRIIRQERLALALIGKQQPLGKDIDAKALSTSLENHMQLIRTCLAAQTYFEPDMYINRYIELKPTMGIEGAMDGVLKLAAGV